MNRVYELAALVGIVATVWWGFCGEPATAEPRMSGGLSDELAWITAALHEEGLHRRSDVVIEIDGRAVAAGFSQVDCDGLLLVAPLPQTAQGWGHVAPRLDLSGFTVQYAYGGTLHADVPQLQRLGDRMIAELRPASVSKRPRLVALAEAGNCELVPSAERVLVDFSNGTERLM